MLKIVTSPLSKFMFKFKKKKEDTAEAPEDQDHDDKKLKEELQDVQE